MRILWQYLHKCNNNYYILSVEVFIGVINDKTFMASTLIIREFCRLLLKNGDASD